MQTLQRYKIKQLLGCVLPGGDMLVHGYVSTGRSRGWAAPTSHPCGMCTAACSCCSSGNPRAGAATWKSPSVESQAPLDGLCRNCHIQSSSHNNNPLPVAGGFYTR